jgi:hypothetical protein
MIVRHEGTTLLLITQPDHAKLSADLVAAMQTEPALRTRMRDVVVLATREHDNGWAEVDAEPDVDPGGRPRDFMTGPAGVRRELWTRGITRVAKMDPHAGALVAHHALTVYSYRQGDPDWKPFFGSIFERRNDLLGQLGLTTGEPREAFELEYRCVFLGDALSLQWCNGWSGPEDALEYRGTLDGDTLVVSPDPFGGATVPFRVPARRIPARRYRSDADLRETMAAAAAVVVDGTARGARPGDDERVG